MAAAVRGIVQHLRARAGWLWLWLAGLQRLRKHRRIHVATCQRQAHVQTLELPALLQRSRQRGSARALRHVVRISE